MKVSQIKLDNEEFLDDVSEELKVEEEPNNFASAS